MAGGERRDEVIRAIRVARGAIIATAARWQALGHVDTSPLVEPLNSIQEALAALEAFDARRVRRGRKAARAGAGRGTVGGRRRRHQASGQAGEELDEPSVQPEPCHALTGGGPIVTELRREYSGLRVSAAAMGCEADPQRLLEWVTLLEQSADRCLAVLDRIDAVPDAVPAAH